MCFRYLSDFEEVATLSSFEFSICILMIIGFQVVYGSGGRKLAFQNLAPLGCLPSVKQANGNVQDCVKLPSEMAALHNKKLLQLLVGLSRQLNGFQYSFYDFFSSIQNRVIKPKTYS